MKIDFVFLCHWCLFEETEPDVYNPDHQRKILKGKQLYVCKLSECYNTIWDKHKRKYERHIQVSVLRFCSVQEATKWANENGQMGNIDGELTHCGEETFLDGTLF